MYTSRRMLLALGLVAVVAVGTSACSKKHTGKNGQPLKELTVDEVAARIAAKDDKTFVFDNNSKERWAESHVPGARWLDFKNVQASDLPSDKAATLVFYCAHPL